MFANNIIARVIKASFRAVGLRVSRCTTFDPRGRDKFIIAPLVEGRLRERGQRFVVIDVGAGGREGDYWTIWRRIGNDTLRLYGFEVDSESCVRLNRDAARAGRDVIAYPAGLWRERREAAFYVTREPDGSSFYRPNAPLIQRWRSADGRSLGEMLTIEKSTELKVTSLDAWKRETSADAVDFIKLNVQGGELEILKGGLSCLDDVLGIQLEMSFNHTYVDAPQFSDVDRFLQSLEFAFFDILSCNYIGRNASPVAVRTVTGESYRWPSRQLLEGEFLYLRDPLAMPQPRKDRFLEAPDRVLKLATIAEIYGQVEYAFELLIWLVEALRGRGQKKEADAIAKIVDKCIAKYRKVL